MSVEENKAIAHPLFSNAWNQGDFTLAEKYVSPDIIDHFDRTRGIESFRRVINTFRTAFPNLRLTIEDEIGEGDKVVHRWTMTGTQQGEIVGIPPTGRTATWTGITIVRFADGKIVERWANVDVLAIMQQLGAIPAAAPA